MESIRIDILALLLICVLIIEANATGRLTINAIYRMSPQEVVNHINAYSLSNKTDSAMCNRRGLVHY